MVAEWVTGTDAGDPSLIELDKTWDGLNYLLTDGNERAGEPWCFLLRGGEEIGEYASYDPVRILQPAQVKAWSAALASLSHEDIKGRYRPEQMDGGDVYPGGWTRDGHGNLQWLLNGFEKLRSGVKRAADQGSGLLLEMW